jgi:hypothetical protein
MFVIPKWKGYEIRTEILDVDENGANTHRLVKIPLEQLPEWDEEHDETGNLRRRRAGGAESPRFDESAEKGVKA